MKLCERLIKEKDLIIKRYMLGESSPAIARSYDTTPATILRYLRQWSVRVRNQTNKNTKTVAIREHPKLGVISDAEIAAELGVSRQHVAHVRRLLGIQPYTALLPSISPEEFIAAWQASESSREVCARLGREVGWVNTRACRYRKKGVPLKRLGMDWDRLAEYASSLATTNYEVVCEDVTDEAG